MQDYTDIFLSVLLNKL